jgi:peptidoglycan hydrolase CwlO-like protein
MPQRSITHALATLVVVGVVAALRAAPSAGDLASRYAAGRARASALQSQISARNQQIQGYEGSIASLQARLDQVQRVVAIQQRLLFGVEVQLTAARNRLTVLQAQYERGRQVLADEVVAEYESPPPNLVGVIVNAHGFDDLLNRVSDLRAIERQNADVVQLVKSQREAVTRQTQRLTLAEQRRRRSAAAVVVERDQIAQLRLSIVRRELVAAHARDAARGRLQTLEGTLSRQAATLDALAAAAQSVSTGGAALAPAGCVNTPFAAHGGAYGFFQAAGTNYSIGETPIIAARLDALGRALGLHLIGISGYRSPQHSVEVGGFADDPHTQGLASDTPGVEGVPEATLARFCLTRPFPGPREADHIQEL